MVLGWRNLPELIATSSSQKAVEQKEHVAWFKRAVSEPSICMFIVLLDGAPSGQVRFERRKPDVWTISAYLLPELTGKGHGVVAIRSGCQRMAQQSSYIVAEIRGDNPRSVAAFRKAGFFESKMFPAPRGHDSFLWRPLSIP
jgi:RimJ/RimL family protein N-acetyltransferase